MATSLYTSRIALLLASLFITFNSSAVSGQSIDLKLRRHAYYRGESIPLTLVTSPEIKDSKVDVYLDEIKATSATLNAASQKIEVPTAMVRTGEYVLKAVVHAESGEAKTDEVVVESRVTIASKPSPHQIDVWLWGGSEGNYYFDHGFTIAGGPHWSYWKEDNRDAYIKNLDKKLARGAGATIWLCGGISRRDLKSIDPEAEDVEYLGAGRHAERFFNPFSSIVEKVRRESNDRLLNSLGDHPAIRVAFFNTELVDHLWLDNLNREGVELTKQELGFTRDERGDANFVAPGILADNDRKYRFEKFVYQQGNGLPHANQKTAEDLRRHRKDVRTMTDPYRSVAYRGLFPGLDIVSTWTYTNNDPKLMHYIETLRATTRGTGQQPMQTVTLLNYPGVIAPKSTPSPEGTDPAHAGWMLMGPDRCKEVSWIILSRAPKNIGYYFSSACNPEKYIRPEDQFRVPHATSLAIKELSERVYKPYGPMITRLRSVPRKIAVLSSQASRLYNSSPRTIGYPNEQIYGFYSVMAMAHLNADVLLDEQIEAGDLKNYDVLAMPRCEVITKSMLQQIQAFQQRGGKIIADQHLGPKLPDVIQFDFDFNYRLKVNADAIESGVMYAEWDDQLNPKTAKLTEAKGITAEDDQKIMESYARQLQQKLSGHVKPAVAVDTPTALVNVLESNTVENNGVKYLVLVNDKRTYGDRVGKYKAIMEKSVPQKVTVTVSEWDGPLHAYDMLQRTPLETESKSTGISFPVELTELGGTIIALYPTELGNITVSVPDSIVKGKPTTMSVTISDKNGRQPGGLQPLHITLTDADGNPTSYSGHYCAENGKLDLTLLPAKNDVSGSWEIKVVDLTAGITEEKTFEVQ